MSTSEIKLHISDTRTASNIQETKADIDPGRNWKYEGVPETNFHRKLEPKWAGGSPIFSLKSLSRNDATVKRIKMKLEYYSMNNPPLLISLSLSATRPPQDVDVLAVLGCPNNFWNLTSSDVLVPVNFNSVEVLNWKEVLETPEFRKYSRISITIFGILAGFTFLIWPLIHIVKKHFNFCHEGNHMNLTECMMPTSNE